MTERQLRLRSGWLGMALPGLRQESGTRATYELVPADALPALQGTLDGTLSWLTPLDRRLAEEMEPFRPERAERKRVAWNLRCVTIAAAASGLRLPGAFIRLMGSPQLQDRIPSGTACWFDLPEQIVPAPVPEGGHVIRFMNDQQGCAYWHLWLRPDGADAVLCSEAQLDREPEDDEEREIRDAIDEAIECAPSFEAFVYRYWLEQCLWFALRDGRPLTEEQEAYAAFYRARG